MAAVWIICHQNHTAALWGNKKLVALLSHTLVLTSSMLATLTKQLLIDLFLLTWFWADLHPAALLSNLCKLFRICPPDITAGCCHICTKATPWVLCGLCCGPGTMGLLWGCCRWGEAPAGIKGRVKHNNPALLIVVVASAVALSCLERDLGDWPLAPSLLLSHSPPRAPHGRDERAPEVRIWFG